LHKLLAPELLVFFDQNLVDIGTKYSLQDMVSSVTVIGDLVYYQFACIAQKMSWAPRREATRVEDRVYNLMGLLGVNMPPLYGEEEMVFHRLLLEMLKISDGESIFAWEDKWSSDIPHVRITCTFGCFFQEVWGCSTGEPWHTIDS
jgi:hypothetical protein